MSAAGLVIAGFSSGRGSGLGNLPRARPGRGDQFLVFGDVPDVGVVGRLVIARSDQFRFILAPLHQAEDGRDRLRFLQLRGRRLDSALALDHGNDGSHRGGRTDSDDGGKSTLLHWKFSHFLLSTGCGEA